MSNVGAVIHMWSTAEQLYPTWKCKVFDETRQFSSHQVKTTHGVFKVIHGTTNLNLKYSIN